MSRSISIDHLARVEGHGGVTIEWDGNAVTQVRFEIFESARLLEKLVYGRSFEDVATILSRICAICSVAHTLTSLKATEDAFGVEVSPQTVLLRDLLFRGENIQSHALHLFFLALPDYLGYPSAAAMAEDKPELVKLALRLKRLGNSIQETIGGRSIHPVNAVAGGIGKLPEDDDLLALRHELVQSADDCATFLDVMAGVPDLALCRSDSLFAALRKTGGDGYYAGDEIVVAAPGARTIVPVAAYRDVTNEKAVPHSLAKHSSFQGQPLTVGALARLTVARDDLNPPMLESLRQLGLTLPSDRPGDNNKAQAAELAADICEALLVTEQLLESGLHDETPEPIHPKAGRGVAATEAPRGLLVHNYTYDDRGRITAADVVTPTAINAAAIEASLRRTVERNQDLDESALRAKLEMVVRAYDPCISCSVHLVRRPCGH